jgi:large subunit ribosomal protein L1
MGSRRSKAYKEAKSKIEDRTYALDDAVGLMKEFELAKFDESVDISFKLGVDPKYPDQMVRGTVVLTNGTGKDTRVLVIATGEKQKEAEEAGADFVGGEEIIEKIKKEDWFDYDIIVATPDMMRHLGKIGKALGPKGLMPSPKAGTVTFNLKETITEIKKGRVEFKVDKTGIINSNVAKKSFSNEKISENITDFVNAVLKAKPVSLKGKYVQTLSLSSTMSPSIKMNITDFEK